MYTPMWSYFTERIEMLFIMDPDIAHNVGP